MTTLFTITVMEAEDGRLGWSMHLDAPPEKFDFANENLAGMMKAIGGVVRRRQADEPMLAFGTTPPGPQSS